jgi:hypothetical protein
MGRWGAGLFEGDSDYDYVGEIEDAAKCRLLNPIRSKDLVAARLDKGLTDRLARKFKDRRPFIVFLAALVVHNGGHVSPEFRELDRDAVGKTPLTEKQWEQINDAYINYKNDGTPWDFESKGLFEVMAESFG